MAKKPTERFLVSYDLPEGQSKSTFYRRLNDLIDQFGGRENCKANGSTYIFSGDMARSAAYAVAMLAQEFGAPGFDDANGVYVAQIVDVPAQTHFDECTRARRVVESLMVNRKTKTGKMTPKSINALIGVNTEHDGNVIDMKKYLEQFDGDARTIKAASK